ncbi:MAG: primosomal protein N', partial [Phototrophicaceae bacterium]
MYAHIALPYVHVTTMFHYSAPEALLARVQPGQMVQVAFRTSIEIGIITALSADWPPELPEQTTLKPIQAILHPTPVVSAAQLALAVWIDEHYLSGVGAALGAMLPPGLTNGRDLRVTLLDLRYIPRDMFQHRVVNLLRRRGTLTGAQISYALDDEDKASWERTVQQLRDLGVVDVEPFMRPPRIRPRQVDMAQIALPVDQIAQVAPTLGRKNRRADLLEAFAALQGAPIPIKAAAEQFGTTAATLKKLVTEGLLTQGDDGLQMAIRADALDTALIALRHGEAQIRALQVLARETEPIELSWIYAQSDADLADLRHLEELGFITLGQRDDWRDPLSNRAFPPTPAHPLTPPQQAALAPILAALDARRTETFLLHGVTGSGKTEIYLAAVEAALKAGRSALVLVPEIALTPQMVARVVGRFPGQVALFHSGLEDAERYDAWRRVREGLAQIVVGARSGLFAPLDNIGVIVLDEEHDGSYKQSPNVDVPPQVSAPHYHARAAAAQLAAWHSAPLILGSATPDLETTYQAERGIITKLELPQRILAHREAVAQQAAELGISIPADGDAPHANPLPAVQVVDMREELKNGNKSLFSEALQRALAETLQRDQQAILFLNRRGKNTHVFCRDCGSVVECPNCDTTLIYHHDGVLRCHRCGHQQPHPAGCSVCGSARIRYFGAGTQEVEQALKVIFPDVRCIRWDADTASESDSHEIYLRHFKERNADVMIGTQMIAKGLDLPLV